MQGEILAKRGWTLGANLPADLPRDSLFRLTTVLHASLACQHRCNLARIGRTILKNLAFAVEAAAGAQRQFAQQPRWGNLLPTFCRGATLEFQSTLPPKPLRPFKGHCLLDCGCADTSGDTAPALQLLSSRLALLRVRASPAARSLLPARTQISRADAPRRTGLLIAIDTPAVPRLLLTRTVLFRYQGKHVQLLLAQATNAFEAAWEQSQCHRAPV